MPPRSARHRCSRRLRWRRRLTDTWPVPRKRLVTEIFEQLCDLVHVCLRFVRTCEKNLHVSVLSAGGGFWRCLTVCFSGARLFARPTASALFDPVLHEWWSSSASAVIFHSNVCTTFRCCTDTGRCVPFRGTSPRVGAGPSSVNPAEACWETSHGAAQSLARYRVSEVCKLGLVQL